MKLRTFRLSPAALFLLPCAGFLALYLATLTGVHTYDALSYILDVDRKPWAELFHPHHLAYGPLGALIRGAATAAGWRGSAEPLLQAANAVAGAIGAGLFALVAARATGRPGLGLIGALLLGASYAFWYYAVEVEVYTIAALFLIAALGLLLELGRRPTVGLAAQLGAAQGLAVLFHQTNVLLCAPAAVALFLGAARRARGVAAAGARPDLAASARGGVSLWGGPGGALRLAAAYLLPLGLIVGGAYLWVGVGLSGFRSWGELSRWAAGYATTGWWGGAVDTGKWAGLLKGLSETVARPGGALLGGALAAALLLGLHGLRAAPRATLATLLSWLLVYGGFFLWWEPDNIEFWIAALPPFYLLLLLGAAGEGGAGSGGGGKRGWWRADVLAGGLGVIGAVMLGVNVVSIRERGDPGRDLQRRITAALAARTAPGDLLVVPDGLQELYLPFYGARVSVAALGPAMSAAGGDWPAACAGLRGRVDTALERGFAVLLADEALRPTPAPPGEPPTMAERFGLPAETVAACYAPYAPTMEPAALGPGLPAYWRIPAAQELADGPGWDFRRGRWGWRATNADTLEIGAAGWTLRPDADPALTSPPVQIEAARFGQIEIRLGATTAAHDAQLFFLDAGGQVDEARSIRWALEPGAGPASYLLRLRGAPGWEGTLTGLRLDPVHVGDGGVVVVESIRLLP